MKSSPKLFAAFIAGAAIASLPYTLSLGQAHAQGAGPAGPPPQGGFPGGFQGGPMPMGGAPINTLVYSGDYIYAGAGNMLYKVNANAMVVEKVIALNPPQRAPRQKSGGEEASKH
jgi:hypothetical protein